MPKKRNLELTLPDVVVLSLLSERPMHGYHLVSELEIRDVKDWAAVSRPQVYYSLNKLMKLSLLKESADSDDNLGPERTIYKINAKGKEKLTQSLSKIEWAKERTLPPFLTWIALSAHLPKPVIRCLFEERRKFLQHELARETATLESFQEAQGAMVVAGKLMVELTVRTFELELEWLEKAQEQLLSK